MLLSYPGVVSFYVSTPHVSVLFNDDVLTTQTNLLWEDGTRADSKKFELLFLVAVPATGLMKYKIK